MILRTCINAMAVFAGLMAPFMPATARRLATALGLPEPPAGPWRQEVDLAALGAGHPLAAPPPLFTKMDADRVAELTRRFGGGEEPH